MSQSIPQSLAGPQGPTPPVTFTIRQDPAKMPKLVRNTKSMGLTSFIVWCWSSNAPDQRPRATDTGHGTQTRPRGSLNPVCSALIALRGYSKLAVLERCHSVGLPEAKSNCISTAKVTFIFPFHRSTLINGGGSLLCGCSAPSGPTQGLRY